MRVSKWLGRGWSQVTGEACGNLGQMSYLPKGCLTWCSFTEATTQICITGGEFMSSVGHVLLEVQET